MLTCDSLDVPLGEIFVDTFQANGVSRGKHEGGGVLGWCQMEAM